MADLPRGVAPRGTYAGGGRSPIVYVQLCPPCAGYAPITDPDYDGFLSGRCQGCGSGSRELHRFQALIMSAANGGCMCDRRHRQVTGDLPTEQSVMQLWTEVKTRPALTVEERRAFRASLRTDAGKETGDGHDDS
jgi:hypothetical protein